jgi:Tfp pilus assembly protein PilN
MNAVNLIPREGRRRGTSVSVSPPTLALAGGLVVALIAAVLYVTTANTVTTRKSELAQVTAGVAGWTAAANSYASFVQAAQRRTQELADVRQLASARFPWSDLLGQIGGLMPKAAALSSLQASSGTADGTSTGSSTSGASAPGVQLSGCAASQSVVAQTMVQLRRVRGVSGVTLTSSSDSGAPSSGSSSGTSSNTGCPFPVQFQLTLTFTPSAAAGTAAPGTATTASAPATPAATTSTPAATTSTPAATTSTPAATQ